MLFSLDGTDGESKEREHAVERKGLTDIDDEDNVMLSHESELLEKESDAVKDERQEKEEEEELEELFEVDEDEDDKEKKVDSEAVKQKSKEEATEDKEESENVESEAVKGNPDEESKKDKKEKEKADSAAVKKEPGGSEEVETIEVVEAVEQEPIPEAVHLEQEPIPSKRRTINDDVADRVIGKFAEAAALAK